MKTIRFETTNNYQQQNSFGRTPQPTRKHLRKIQKIIRNEPHNQQYRSEDPNKTGMLPYPTESKTETVPPTKRRKKRTRLANKIRTPRKTRNNRRRLFRITRSNYGEKRQNGEHRTRCPQTQQRLCEETTTHAKHGGITEPNIRRIIQERPRPSLDSRNRY